MPDRVIIGCDNPVAGDMVRDLYAPFLRSGNPLLLMDIRSAELMKYAANAALAARITLMNELANICERVGADIDLIRKGIAMDKRIGSEFLFPGIGYGGSCFPADIRMLIHTAREYSYIPRMIEAMDQTDQSQPVRFAERIAAHFGQAIDKSRLAVWGLSFKASTSDIRESPSVKIIELLLEHGLRIAVYDPEASQEAMRIFGHRIEVLSDSYACLKEADALAVLTEWPAFRNPHFDRMKRLMRQPVIFDGRNIYDPRRVRGLGFTYYGVGRVKVDKD
jgi:UDPglucose 6-dehydrogenase